MRIFFEKEEVVGGFMETPSLQHFPLLTLEHSLEIRVSYVKLTFILWNVDLI